MCEKKRRRFYLPFIESPIPLFELKCWECGNRIVFGVDERGYYVEEAKELVFEPPLVMKARLAEKPQEDEVMKIRMGLETTEVLLTDVGKKWFKEHYPKGDVYEYDENGKFRLDSMMVIESRAVAQIICPLGIPYKIPADIDDQTTIRTANQEELSDG